MQEYPKLITRSVVQAAMNIPASTATDEIIDRYIGWISNTIQKRAGQPIACSPIVIDCQAHATMAGYESRDGLMLPYWPVSALTKLETSDGQFGSSYTEISQDDCELLKIGSLYYIRCRNGFICGYYYRATLMVGYDDIPGEIQKVALEMVQIMLRQSNIASIGKDRLGVKAVTITDTRANTSTVTTLMESHPEWDEVIRMYAVGEEL